MFRDVYFMDPKTFVRQNVSGDETRCFETRCFETRCFETRCFETNFMNRRLDLKPSTAWRGGSYNRTFGSWEQRVATAYPSTSNIQGLYMLDLQPLKPGLGEVPIVLSNTEQRQFVVREVDSWFHYIKGPDVLDLQLLMPGLGEVPIVLSNTEQRQYVVRKVDSWFYVTEFETVKRLARGRLEQGFSKLGKRSVYPSTSNIQGP